METIQQFGAHQVVLCGDFNCTPSSSTYNFLGQHFHSAYKEPDSASHRAVWEDLEGLQGHAAWCTATNATAGPGFAELLGSGTDGAGAMIHLMFVKICHSFLTPSPPHKKIFGFSHLQM